jgi:hypothetical protein
MNRLLILSCSRSKRAEAELLPAYERYDGPSFRLLRRFLNQKLNQPSVYILSAEYGLIHSNQRIPFYDRQMTKQRALELRPTVTAKLKRIFNNKLYDEAGEALVCLGKDYFQVVDADGTLFSSTPLVKVAEGSLGRKLSCLHDWLYGHPPKVSSSTQKKKDKAVLRDVELDLTPTQVFDIARTAIAERRGNPTGFKSWYVTVDKVRISAKWLVSQMTGVPVSGFSTGEALGLLFQLNIKVERV